MELQIRIAELSDLDSIMKVESEGFISQIQENREVFEKRILACPQLFLVFENQENKKVSGYLSAEFLNEIPLTAQELALGHEPKTINNHLEQKYIYISSFSILPEVRGNGNGKLLWNKSIEYFEKNFPSADFILLVNEEWKAAKHIYEKKGFKQLKVFKAFFPSESQKASDGILMMKQIKS